MEFQTTSLGYQKQVRAIIVFGDIHGFSVWEQSVTRPEIEFQPLINKFDSMLESFALETGWFTKNLGDGYMQAIELPDKKKAAGKLALEVTVKTWKFAYAVHTMIINSPWPRPKGFRIRRSSGYVWKKEGHRTDFVGRHCNNTNKFLRVSPEKFCLDHQSFVELVPGKQLKNAGYRYVRRPPIRRIPDGILKEDAGALSELVKSKK